MMLFRLGLVVALLFGATGASAAQGFLTDSPKALAQAKKEKKPILIDFFGIWCPPCNELDETVFESTGFLQKAKQFVLLKVDADAKTSWAIKDRYKVGGYPTVVFASPEGKELYRIVGYRTPKEFLRVMDMVLAAKGRDVEKACKSTDAEDLWRCATICSERKDTACADGAFKKLESKLPKGSARYQLARTYFVESSPNVDTKRLGYEQLMTEMPQTPLALVWATEYLATFEDTKTPSPKKEPIERVLSFAAQMPGDPNLDALGLSVSDVAQARADVLEKVGRKDEAKAAWKEAAALLEKQAAELPAGAPARGFTIDRIGCLQEAGELEAALKLANEYRAKFPEEFTFHFWAARVLQRAKKYAEALPAAKKAYDVSYGDNKIRAATLLIELYGTVPDKDAARKVHEAVTKEIKPDTALQIRTHRYLKRLDEALQKVQSA